MGYPGGPAIEQFALEGNSARYPLPRAWLKDSDDFSFSGLKTAVLHLVEKECKKAQREPWEYLLKIELMFFIYLNIKLVEL